jgi:hypothetical protein
MSQAIDEQNFILNMKMNNAFGFLVTTLLLIKYENTKMEQETEKTTKRIAMRSCIE